MSKTGAPDVMLDVRFGMTLVRKDGQWSWPRQFHTVAEVDGALSFSEEQLERRLALIRSARTYMRGLDFTEVTK
jgi:hypothetical protein